MGLIESSNESNQSEMTEHDKIVVHIHHFHFFEHLYVRTYYYYMPN